MENSINVETTGDINIDSAVEFLLPLIIEHLNKAKHDQPSRHIPKIEQRPQRCQHRSATP
ncbi:MAG: hypothetical protein COA83_09835 [Methylophaga sp.]|nr:MAG: hypothetical protein COA83_09835 [Methylophaga sp.]